jgi:hypothetical protein
MSCIDLCGYRQNPLRWALYLYSSSTCSDRSWDPARAVASTPENPEDSEQQRRRYNGTAAASAAGRQEEKRQQQQQQPEGGDCGGGGRAGQQQGTLPFSSVNQQHFTFLEIKIFLCFWGWAVWKYLSV